MEKKIRGRGYSYTQKEIDIITTEVKKYPTNLRHAFTESALEQNKEEIMAEAREYGTFDISIRPHEDCCSLFLPEHPETRAKIEIVRLAEASIEGLADLERTAIANLDKFTV